MNQQNNRNNGTYLGNQAFAFFIGLCGGMMIMSGPFEKHYMKKALATYFVIRNMGENRYTRGAAGVGVCSGVLLASVLLPSNDITNPSFATHNDDELCPLEENTCLPRNGI